MKRIIKTADEYDAYSRWRHVMSSMQRPGAVKKIKRRTHKRERREAGRWIGEQVCDRD